jgi:ABC-type transport system involved in cytochrome c biogenesis permease subunit
MKKAVSLIILVAVAVYVASTFRQTNRGPFDLKGFGELPALANGRIKPLDTVARSSLLQLQGKQTVVTPDGRKPSPIEWFLDVSFRPELADTYQTFEIVNPDLLALLDLNTDDGRDGKRFAFHQLSGKLAEIDRQARLANQVESAVRSPFQRAVLQLYVNLLQYQRLRHALVMPGRPDFLGDLLKFQENLADGVAAVRARQAGEPHDEDAVKAVTAIGEQFIAMAEATNLHVVPPGAEEEDPTAWDSVGATLLQTFRTGRVSASALAYAGFAHAWRHQQVEQFNKLVELFRAELAKRYEPQLAKARAESRFNSIAPFYTSMGLYVLAFIVGIAAWLVWPQTLGRTAFWIVAIAWVLSTVGIATRMWLEGRPPVTNLYSSALFVGWGAVGLCLILESIYKNAVSSVAASAIGFATLLIAHHLSLGGDTLEMMRAVLDSNFWLATHVIVITAGYSATFLAGFLAMIYVARGVFTTTLDKVTADSLARMVYGIICFATLFSFAGTVLGGIWADQSWGRFWGWDPKENGALLIVMWCALILHARWGGMIGQRGLMSLAIGGNIVTSWSWFGTNMLGVGLHSYGFTDSGFVALSSFVVSQLIFVGIASIPLARWRSFHATASPKARQLQTVST